MKPWVKRIVEGFVILLIVAIVAAILFPIVSSGPLHSRVRCLSNLKMLGLEFSMYDADYDDKLPPRDYWMDLIKEYQKGETIDHCDSVVGVGLYGYALNAGVKSLADNPKLSTTPLVYDSVNLARNASDLATSLPLPGRHRGGNFICYADIHAKYVKTIGP